MGVQRISGMDFSDIPGVCDDNFNNLDRRLTRLEDGFEDIDDKLGKIGKVLEEVKDCVKPRLAEFGVRIGNIESSQAAIQKSGIFPSRYLIIVLLGSAIAGGGSGQLIDLIIKLIGK